MNYETLSKELFLEVLKGELRTAQEQGQDVSFFMVSTNYKLQDSYNRLTTLKKQSDILYSNWCQYTEESLFALIVPSFSEADAKDLANLINANDNFSVTYTTYIGQTAQEHTATDDAREMINDLVSRLK